MVYSAALFGNPKCVDYRQTPLTYYNALVELFEGTYATGEYAITSDEPCPTDFLTGTNAPTPASGSLSGPTVEASSEAHAPASTTSTSPPPLSSAGAPPQQGNQQKIKKRTRESGGAMIADAMKEIACEMHNRNVHLKVLSPS
ncbi:Hypothetical protein PHPALM_38132 [Phytophthora palmivora]|uniref:Uncharacterized protein n=1 Tax=Phytophthora palmivora TaxID=4796 RepID=A0A2P4WVN2_9STRA|nr:Hypothetical protein PHPALM_38132 [Phytophthora palmivora]